MNISKQHLPIGRKRTGQKIYPKKITIHGTGNPNSTAQNERDYLSNPINTNSIGYHYVVGDDVIIEIAPPNERMVHAGHNVGNSTSIGIEMVETGDRQQVIKNTIDLVKYLKGRFGISDSNVVRHYDWTRKNCPRILNYNNWQGWKEFKSMLGNTSGGNISNVTPAKNYLQIKDRGSSVKALQSNLSKLGFNTAVDGIFGKNTEKAVMGFQGKYGLSIDGVAGIVTQSKIQELLDMSFDKNTWQQKAGEKAIDRLITKEVLTDPQEHKDNINWKDKNLKNDNVPLWLFFEMMDRIAK